MSTTTTERRVAPPAAHANAGALLKQAILPIGIVCMCALFSIFSDKFFTTSNVISILRQIASQAIVAIGMTMIIILGQIDLSVGSIVAFASVINALMIKAGVPLWLAILLTILISSLWGTFSGWITAKYNIHAFLVTLAVMTVARGVAYILTDGYPVGGMPDSFFSIGGGHLGIIPIPVLYMLLFYALFIFILNWTPFGRAIYASGGNPDAARLSGINVQLVRIVVFTLSAALSAVAGIIVSSRLMSGAPDIGTSWEMDVIAATIIGGTNMNGGEGKLWGTLLGMLFMGILSNGMVLLNFSPYTQTVVKGLVILVAVIMNAYQKRK